MKRKKSSIIVLLALSLLLVFSSSVSAAPLMQPMQKVKTIADKIDKNRIQKHIERLADADNPRLTGFDGEHKAANYLEKRLKNYKLKTDRQIFPVLAYIARGSEITINSPESKQLESNTFEYTPATPAEGITSDIVYADLGKPEDFEGLDLEGKIAFIKRGELSFYDKVQNAAAAGAIGAIIFNHSDGIISGTLTQISDIPALAMNKEEGEWVKSLLDEGQTVSMTIKADAEYKPSYSQNVIAELPAKIAKKKAKTIVIGAHYDSIDGPGANDNASGTATLLEVAKALSKEKFRHNIRFIFFGAEESGLIGAEKYVESLSDEEKQDIAAMINLDMVGVGDTLNIMTAAEDSSSFVADLAEEYVSTYGYNYERGASTRSDHKPFEDAGIPVAFFHYSEDPYYHTDEDTPDKIDKDNLYRVGTLTALLINHLGNQKKLPEREEAPTMKIEGFTPGKVNSKDPLPAPAAKK
ncbi:M28 family metallopeptidase [Mechercharimyces sp. CAU 1602]|uniref:M28 family metallopeptidase n=1 Tax=Mechercharimyces sp. CAU 1602 TaxID=2973933 RepID=UPI0021614D45|nr:M28 family metallopeptidase [Mechercharimyces sp. CAU 1602]MCS1351941.1 M28 family metallopeptidase [Mechercharimyces sp. CAU 1602]